MNPLSPLSALSANSSVYPQAASASGLPAFLEVHVHRPLVILTEAEENGRSLLNTQFSYPINHEGIMSTRSLSSSLGRFLVDFLDDFSLFLDSSHLILTDKKVIHFRITNKCPMETERLRVALRSWLSCRDIDPSTLRFQYSADDFDAECLQIPLPTIPENIILQFSSTRFIASDQDQQPVDLLPFLPSLEPMLSLLESFAPENDSNSGSSSDIDEFIEDSHASKTADQLLEELNAPGSSPVAYALLAILLFKKPGKLKDPVIVNALIQKVRGLVTDLIHAKQELLASELWTCALRKIPFQALEDLKKQKEAPHTEKLLKALAQESSNEDLDKRFDAILTLYNQLLSLKPSTDRVLLGKLLEIFTPSIPYFLLHLPNEQRKDKIERVIGLLQMTAQCVDLPIQMKMRDRFAAGCAIPELFQIANECLSQIYQTQKNENGGIVKSELKHLINQFILASLSIPESDLCGYWKKLFDQFASVKEGEQALFDASLIQKMTPQRYLQSEEEFLSYPLERFLSFFKVFAQSLSPQPAGAAAACSSSSANLVCSTEVGMEAALERALIKGLGRIDKAPLSAKQKQTIISEHFTETLLGQFSALKGLCEELIKKPSERDLLIGIGKLFPELADKLNALQINAESYYSELTNILVGFLETQSAEQQALHLDKMHPLFSAEEKKQLALRPSENHQWTQNYSKLITLHLSLLAFSSVQFKKAIPILKKALQDNLILIEGFRATFTDLYCMAMLRQEGQEDLLLAICTESNLNTQQFFYSGLITILARIMNALDSNQLKKLDALAEEFSQFRKKWNLYSKEIKVEALLLHNKLQCDFPLLKTEPAAAKLCVMLDLLLWPSSGSSSSSAQSNALAAMNTKEGMLYLSLDKFYNLLDEDPVTALEHLKRKEFTHLNEPLSPLDSVRFWLLAMDHLLKKGSLFFHSIDIKRFHSSILHVCTLSEKQQELLLGQMMSGGDKATLEKEKKELEILTGDISTFYTKLGAVYHANNTAEVYQEGITLLHNLMTDFPNSNTIHRCLRPYFYCTPSIHPSTRQGKAIQIEKSLSVLLNLAEAYSALNKREEALVHRESIWQHPRFTRTTDITESLGRDFAKLKKWDKALYYITFLTKLNADDPIALGFINKTIGFITLAKQISERRALSSFPQYAEGNDNAFESFSDLMIHFLNVSRYEWSFYGKNLLAHFNKRTPLDLPQSEVAISNWILEQTLSGLLSDGNLLLACDLYIASADYLNPDEMDHLDEMIDLPFKILERLWSGKLSNMHYILHVTYRLIIEDHVKLNQIPFPELPSLILDCYHPFFIAAVPELFATAERNPEQFPIPLAKLYVSRLLTYHFQLALTDAFKSTSPRPSLAKAVDFFLEMDKTMPNMGQYDSQTLKTAYEANQELTKQLTLFKESKSVPALILALGALRELHTCCPKNLMLQDIVCNRTCVVALHVYTTLQEPKFDARPESLDEIASGFIDLFVDEQTGLWLNHEMQNKQQLRLLVTTMSAYIAQKRKANANYPFKRSQNAALRLTSLLASLNKKQENFRPAFNLADLSRDKVLALLSENLAARDSVIHSIALFTQATSKMLESFQSEETDGKKHLLLFDQSGSLIIRTIDQLHTSLKQLRRLIASAQGPRKQQLDEIMRSITLCLESSYIELKNVYSNVEIILLKGNFYKYGSNHPLTVDPKAYYQVGAKCFKQALVENPDSEAALEGLGTCLLSPFNPNQAAEALDYLKKGNPRNPFILTLTLKALYQLHQYQEVLELFENRAVSASHLFSADEYSLLAQAAVELKDSNRAAHYYEQMYAHATRVNDMITAQRAIASLQIQKL